MPMADASRQKKIEQKRKKRAQELEARERTKARLTDPNNAAERAAGWPLRGCHISPLWETRRLATVIVARDRPDGGVAAVSYLVDLGCLGVKRVRMDLDLSVGAFAVMIERLGGNEPLEPCDPALAAGVVLAGERYAAGLGFSPGPGYAAARQFLRGIGPAADIPCGGPDGRPLFIPGPDDDAPAILAQIARKLGRETFGSIVPLGPRPG
jgi:hypothetical protein